MKFQLHNKFVINLDLLVTSYLIFTRFYIIAHYNQSHTILLSSSQSEAFKLVIAETPELCSDWN